MTGHELAMACAKALSEKKAQDIVILDVADQTVVCSYFVIASGHSTTQVRALGDAVEEKLEKEGLSGICSSSYTPCGLAMPRRQEIYSCFNRYRR